MRECLFLFIVSLGRFTLSADILAVFPHTGKSHFDVFEGLLLELAAKGHHLTVISFFPQSSAVPNYTDISLVGVAPTFVNALKFEHLQGLNGFTDFLTITGMGVDSCEPVLTSTPVQNLLRSPVSFDLLLVELFNTDCFLGFMARFKAPYIAVSSSSLFPTAYPRLGSFDHPAYFPNLFFPFAPRMSLSQRLLNALVTAAMRLAKSLTQFPIEQDVALRVFGPAASLGSIAYNVSLALVNSHFSLQGARPLPPSVVEVGGLHIRPSPHSLPQELEKFINESPEGVILFSMGSVLQSSSFPDKKRQAFMDAFAELPVRVIMKWENESLPGKPDNVRLSMWLPQRDILAHPKVLAFLGHGGLLSTSEAVYCGVPMVLVPMFGDQPNNVAHLQASGAAVKLPYEDISKEKILAALKAVLYDPRYRETARLLSAQFRDRPMSPLDTAVYWVEYVLRHQGAPHLQSPAVNMPWYQLWLLDVALALLIIPLVLLIAVWILTKRAVSIFCGAFQHNYPEQEKKTK